MGQNARHSTSGLSTRGFPILTPVTGGVNFCPGGVNFCPTSRIPRNADNWEQGARVRSQRGLVGLMAGIDQGREQKSSESTDPS